MQASISKISEDARGAGALWAKLCPHQTGEPGRASEGVGKDGTPLGGDLHHIYPMGRPPAIPDPFSMGG
jgi:hypothetical protein